MVKNLKSVLNYRSYPKNIRFFETSCI